MKSNFVLRARLLSALFILAALLLASRLYFVQIVHGAEYRRNAGAQYSQPSHDTEARGDIFFTKKTAVPSRRPCRKKGGASQ